MTTKTNNTEVALKRLISAEVERSLASLAGKGNSPVVSVTQSNDAADVNRRISAQVIRAYARGPGANDPRAKDIVRAMGAGSTGAGKELAPEEYSSDVILAIAHRAVLGQIAGAKYDNYEHEISLPKLSAQSVQWVAEGGGPTPTDPTSSTVKLGSFRAVAAVKVSGELLRRPDSVADEGLGANMVKAVAAAVDSKLLSGLGASNEPTGIIAQIASANKYAATRTATDPSTPAEIEGDLVQAMALVHGSGIEKTDKASFVMPSKEFFHLMSLRDPATGALIFPELRGDEPRLFGARVFVTGGLAGVLYVEGSMLALGLPFATPVNVEVIGDDRLNDAVTVFSRAHVDAKLFHDVAGAHITDTAARWV